MAEGEEAPPPAEVEETPPAGGEGAPAEGAEEAPPAEAAEAPPAEEAEVMPEGEDVEAAAAKIQAIQRGKAGRKQVAGLKVEKELGLTGSPEEQAQIAKMQAMQRGKAARKEMDEQKDAAAKIQAVHRGKAARKEVASMSGSTKVTFVIHHPPEDFTYELECPPEATWAQAKQAMEQHLTIKAEHMRIRVDGRSIEDDTVTLKADGVTDGMQLDLDVVYTDDSPSLDPVMQGDALLVTVERGDHESVNIQVHVDKSEMVKKSYLGGYRNKKSNVEYHHACTQTPPDAAMIIRAEEAFKKVMTVRTTQTVVQQSRSVSTVRETATQMNPPYLPLLVDESKDTVLHPRPYFSADQLWHLKAEKTLVIQCHARGWFARRVATELRRQLHAQQEFIRQQAQARAEEAEEMRKQEIERRMHPRTAADITVLHNELESWRLKETKRIHADESLNKEDRQVELEMLLGKETQLLQTIDRLKISAATENKRDRTAAKIDVMAEAKLWALSDGDAITVHTPFTSRARELKELYKGLEMSGLSIDERLDVLLHVKWTVTEFDCPLTRDVVQLIDREADMLNRGRTEKSLAGLRKRLQNLFLHFLMTPEFNPESSRFQKVPPEFGFNLRVQPIR